ncbi:MAG: diguanylate cyclase [Thermoanaerobaculum sp.]|nr:diguanylate cyclase [Thermoanaerobaculum sp.]MDW7966688.1 diguanylate cyclase [Thermoanaerobaculum sp.]
MSWWRWPRGLQAAVWAGALLLLFGWQVRQHLATADRRVGISLEAAQGGVLVTSVAPEGPAAAAGLRAGDVIVRVNEAPVASLPEYDRQARAFQRGVPVAVAVLRQGRVVELTVRPGMPPDWLPLVLNLLGVLAYFLVGVLGLYAPAEDPRRAPLVLFVLAVALELALPSFPFGPPGLDAGRYAVFFLLTGAQMALELRLVSLIPQRASWLIRRPQWAQGLTLVGLGVGLVLALVLVLSRWQPGGLGLSPQLPFQLLNFLVLPGWAVAVVGVLWHQAQQALSPLGRQQALLVLVGSAPWAGFVIVSGVLQLLGVSLPRWSDYLQSLCLLAFPVAVFVAVYRYQFLDFEHLVRRTLLYTALTGALVLVFYLLLGTGSVLLSEWIGGGVSVVLVSGATLALGLLFSPLRAWLQRIIDQRFFPERYAQRQQLVQLAAELPRFGKVQTMSAHLVAKISEVFAAPRVTVLLVDSTNQLLVATASTTLDLATEFDSAFLLSREDRAVNVLGQAGTPLPATELAPLSASMAQRLAIFGADLVVPVLGPRDLVGLLLLGGRGESWGPEELELATLLCHHVGAVLENARLFEAATVDSLTGLLRRETILDQLDREWLRATRYGRPLAVAMADVDFFKAVNDRYGHLVGDALLKRVALLLQQEVRASDLVGRYGGEEFLLVFPETDLVGAKAVAEKLRQRVAEAGVVNLEQGGEVRVTASFGVAAWVPESPGCSTWRELVDLADRRLLQAKSLGRNRVES